MPLALGMGLSLAGPGGGSPISLNIRDEFTTAQAAPLVSPRTCEPGPGTLYIVDPDGKLSVTASVLRRSASSGTGQAYCHADLRPRAAGRAFLVRFPAHQTTGGDSRMGWSDAAATAPTNRLGIRLNATSLLTYINGSTAASLALAIADYQVAIVQRPTGAYFLIKGGAYTDWTLVWVDASSTTASLAPTVHLPATITAQTDVDDFVSQDLGSPWDTQNGTATQALTGTRAAGDAFTHTANAWLEWTQTTLPSSGTTNLQFRRQDASNYWRATVSSSGALSLDEVVAGTVTNRATAAGVVAAGNRCVVIADGAVIRGYSANTLRWTYSSATGFQTATAGLLDALGTGGAVSDVIAWPRTFASLGGL